MATESASAVTGLPSPGAAPSAVQQQPLVNSAAASASLTKPRTTSSVAMVNADSPARPLSGERGDHSFAASLLGHASPTKKPLGAGPQTPLASPSKSTSSNSVNGSPSKQATHSPKSRPPEPVYITSKDFGPCAGESSISQEAVEFLPAPTSKESIAKRGDRKSKVDAMSAITGKDGSEKMASASLDTAHGRMDVKPKPANHPSRKAASQPPAPLLKFNHSNIDVNSSRENPGIPTGVSTPRHPPPRLRPRLFDLQEAPTFYPSVEEFSDPMRYIEAIGRIGAEYGIVKVVPPEGWSPECVLDQETFRFRTRVQQLNELTADARASENYLEQLDKFHAQQGLKRVTIPVIDRRSVDLYALKLTVASYGGYDNVCRMRRWSEVTRRIGYCEKDSAHLSTQVKAAYSRIIQPYEEFLLKAKEQVRLSQSATSPVIGQGAAASGSFPSARAQDAAIKSASPATDGAANGHHYGAATGTPEPYSSHTAELLATEKLDEATSSLETPSGGKRRSSRKKAETSGFRCAETPTSGRKRKASSPPATVGGGAMPKDKVSVLPGAEEQMCEICFRGEDGVNMLLCDECNRGYHMYCLEPPLTAIPKSQWFCPSCLISVGRDYGFHDGETHSLYTFWQRAESFKRAWWLSHPDRIWDPSAADDGDAVMDGNSARPRTNGLARRIPDTDLIASEDDVEREFWRLVHSRDEVVEVEYGADVHSTTHGSALPTPETHPLSPYSKDRWNLNNLPILPASLLQYIKSDISGMTVPWIYVGMMFSTFCWHNEDHFTYSINYQHWGETKTWYGIPGADAEKFEAAMRKVAPDLFETTPDLLFHLTTMMSPERLKAEGVRVYACDQRANEFVITFPKAYHSGFNQGLNLNEAVNFALPDWIDYGRESTERYQLFRKGPVFSHDQLLITVSQQNHSVATATWLQHAMKEMVDREIGRRNELREKVPDLTEMLKEDDLPERDYSCVYCQAFCYLSQVVSDNAEGPACLIHAFEVCKVDPPSRWTLRKRFADEQLRANQETIAQRAALPRSWEKRVESMLVNTQRPPLKLLKTLLAEGDKLQFPMKPLENLRDFVGRANGWIERANVFLVRKLHKRRTEVAGGGGSSSAPRSRRSLAAEEASSSRQSIEANDDATSEVGSDRSAEALTSLLGELKSLRFEAPEITALQSLATELQAFQARAEEILRSDGGDEAESPSIKECEEILTLGASLNIDSPQMEKLSSFVERRKWIEHIEDAQHTYLYSHEVQELIDKADACGLAEHPLRTELERRLKAGKDWSDRALALLNGNEPLTMEQLQELSDVSTDVAAVLDAAQRLTATLSKGKDLQQKLKALYNDTEVHDAVVDGDGEAKAPPTEEARRNLLTEARRVLRASKANRLSLEYSEEIQMAVTLFDVWRGDLHTDVVSHFAPHRRLGDTEKRVELDKLVERVYGCTEPDDESVTWPKRHCICRTSDEPPLPSNASLRCRKCSVVYHASCLKLKPAEVSKLGGEWACPVCDLASLEALLAVRKSVPLAKVAALVESPKYCASRLRFPPAELVIVRSMLQRLLHLQQLARDFVETRGELYHDPTIRASAHLCRKLLGCPIDVTLADGSSAIEELARGTAARLFTVQSSRQTDGDAIDPALTAPSGANSRSQPASIVRAIAPGSVAPSDAAVTSAATRTRALVPAAATAAGSAPPAGIGSTDVSYDHLGQDEQMLDVSAATTPQAAAVHPMHDSPAHMPSYGRAASWKEKEKEKEKKRKRGKRAKLRFREEIGLQAHRDGKPIYCLCHEPEREPMIACDKCMLWFHTDCVGLGDPPVLDGEAWNCPMCCIKAERKYPQAEVRVRDIGVTEKDLYLDVRATLRSTGRPISKIQPWPASSHYTRIVLHLESFVPAIQADDARPEPNKRSRPDSESPVKRGASGAAEVLETSPATVAPTAPAANGTSVVPAAPIAASAAASAAAAIASSGVRTIPSAVHAVSSINDTTVEDIQVHSTHPPPSASPIPQHVAGAMPAPIMRMEAQQFGLDGPRGSRQIPLGPTDPVDVVRQRHLEGRKNLFLRGVSDAMLQRHYIAFNGATLVYVFRDVYGSIVELPLGDTIALDYDDPEGSRVIQAALHRFHRPAPPPPHHTSYSSSSGPRSTEPYPDGRYRSDPRFAGAPPPALPPPTVERYPYPPYPERTHSESARYSPARYHGRLAVGPFRVRWVRISLHSRRRKRRWRRTGEPRVGSIATVRVRLGAARTRAR
uniref:[histone H3]-trimethyl-L-lysine(4) demethylase n=1 Tax=Thecaphora frezii TaxID=1269715 RepID=A0A8T9MV82_9BASI|nr:putative Rum1 protein [Thecaphora frezii]